MPLKRLTLISINHIELRLNLSTASFALKVSCPEVVFFRGNLDIIFTVERKKEVLIFILSEEYKKI